MSVSNVKEYINRHFNPSLEDDSDIGRRKDGKEREVFLRIAITIAGILPLIGAIYAYKQITNKLSPPIITAMSAGSLFAISGLSGKDGYLLLGLFLGTVGIGYMVGVPLYKRDFKFFCEQRM